MGSVLGAFRTIKRVRREEKEECERRLEIYKQGVKEGLHMEERE